MLKIIILTATFLTVLVVNTLGENVVYLPADEEDGILLTKCYQTIGKRKRIVECRVGSKCIVGEYEDPETGTNYIYASCTWTNCRNILAFITNQEKIDFKMKHCRTCDKSLCNDFTPSEHQIRGYSRDGELVHTCAETSERDVKFVSCFNQTRCIKLDFTDKQGRKFVYAGCATADEPSDDCNNTLIAQLIDRYPDDWKVKNTGCVSCEQRRCNMLKKEDYDFLVAVNRTLPKLEMRTRHSRSGAKEIYDQLKKHEEL